VPSPLAFFSFGFGEILLVAFVALLVFGGDLPDVMRSLGRAYAKLRAGLHDMSRPVREEFTRAGEAVRQAAPPPLETTAPAAPAAPRPSPIRPAEPLPPVARPRPPATPDEPPPV
jgi:Sec-independent protein translocase protein TatA